MLDIPFSIWTIVVGHATFCIVVIYNNVIARLRRTSPNLIEASMDLGADGSRQRPVTNVVAVFVIAVTLVPILAAH